MNLKIERTSSQIELAALEAIDKAIASGHIDVRNEKSQSITEGLYLLLNQYQEEIMDLRNRLHKAEMKLEALSFNEPESGE